MGSYDPIEQLGVLWAEIADPSAVLLELAHGKYAFAVGFDLLHRQLRGFDLVCELHVSLLDSDSERESGWSNFLRPFGPPALSRRTSGLCRHPPALSRRTAR